MKRPPVARQQVVHGIVSQPRVVDGAVGELQAEIPIATHVMTTRRSKLARFMATSRGKWWDWREAWSK